MLKKLQQVLGFSALAGAIAYATLWLAYYQFYSRIQVTPEEVGIDKVDLLSQALVGPALLFITLVASYGLWMVAMIVAMIFNLRYVIQGIPDLIDLIRGKQGEPFPPSRPHWTLKERMFIGRRRAADLFKTIWSYARRTAVVVATATFVIIAIELCNEARDRGNDLVAGRPVQRPHFSLSGLAIPLLEIRATPVEVAWVGAADQGDPLASVAGKHASCLLYLGNAGGTTILFDPPTGSVHRLPTGAAALQLKPADERDSECERDSPRS